MAKKIKEKLNPEAAKLVAEGLELVKAAQAKFKAAAAKSERGSDARINVEEAYECLRDAIWTLE